MKKRRILIMVVGVSLLILGGLGLLASNYINSAMDYRKTLAVNNEKTGGIVNLGTADAKESIAELEKAKADVEQLQKIEQEENRAAENSGTAEDSVYYDANVTAKDLAKLDEDVPNQKDAVTSLPQHKSNIVNILLLGLDRDLARDKTMGVYRTDTMSIASINLDTNKIKVLSIPRDTYVYIPLHGKKDKINTAYVWGGMGSNGLKSTIDVVNTFIKYTTIDYYFCIDMEPVPDIVNALGGVEVDVDMDLTKKGIDLKKGLQVLDGDKSLIYIRYRYTTNGDIDRIRHQQTFCKAMLKKMQDKDQLLTDIRLVLSHSQYIKTNLNIQQMLAFGALARGIKADDITFDVVPGENAKINKMWYWLANMNSTDKLLKEVFGVK